jgi:hypothetical protein
VVPVDFHEILHKAIERGSECIEEAIEGVFPGQVSVPAVDIPHLLADLNRTRAWLTNLPLGEIAWDPFGVPQTQFLQGLPDEIEIDDLPKSFDKNQGGPREITLNTAGFSETLGDSDQEFCASQRDPSLLENEQLTETVTKSTKPCTAIVQSELMQRDFLNEARWKQEIEMSKQNKPRSSTSEVLSGPKEADPPVGGEASQSSSQVDTVVVTIGMQQLVQRPRTGPEVTLISQRSWNALMRLRDPLSGTWIQYEGYKVLSQAEQSKLCRQVRLSDGTEVSAYGPFRMEIRVDGIQVVVLAYVTRDGRCGKRLKLGCVKKRRLLRSYLYAQILGRSHVMGCLRFWIQVQDRT